jgi:hypothetical protein
VLKWSINPISNPKLGPESLIHVKYEGTCAHTHTKSHLISQKKNKKYNKFSQHTREPVVGRRITNIQVSEGDNKEIL